MRNLKRHLGLIITLDIRVPLYKYSPQPSLSSLHPKISIGIALCLLSLYLYFCRTVTVLYLFLFLEVILSLITMTLMHFGSTTPPTSGEKSLDLVNSSSSSSRGKRKSLNSSLAKSSDTKESSVQELIHRTRASTQDEAISSSSRLEFVVPALRDEEIGDRLLQQSENPEVGLVPQLVPDISFDMPPMKSNSKTISDMMTSGGLGSGLDFKIPTPDE